MFRSIFPLSGLNRAGWYSSPECSKVSPVLHTVNENVSSLFFCDERSESRKDL